ncbi:MAG: hypothetical protein ACLT76_10375 [Clostridium fessum]
MIRSYRLLYGTTNVPVQVRADEDDVERAEVVGTAFHDEVCFAI